MTESLFENENGNFAKPVLPAVGNVQHKSSIRERKKNLIKTEGKGENMFSYYGSKSKIVDYYPPPKHKRIIEPFAGSARYSLKYFDREINLYDKYPIVIEVWHYFYWPKTYKQIRNSPR